MFLLITVQKLKKTDIKKVEFSAFAESREVPAVRISPQLTFVTNCFFRWQCR